MPVCWAEVHLLSGYVLSCHNWRELSARSHKILQMTKIFLRLMLTHPFAEPQRSLFPSLLQDLHPNLFMHCLGCFFYFCINTLLRRTTLGYVYSWVCVVLQLCCSSRKTNK